MDWHETGISFNFAARKYHFGDSRLFCIIVIDYWKRCWLVYRLSLQRLLSMLFQYYRRELYLYFVFITTIHCIVNFIDYSVNKNRTIPSTIYIYIYIYILVMKHVLFANSLNSWNRKWIGILERYLLTKYKISVQKHVQPKMSPFL